jgi:hypothetical protein
VKWHELMTVDEGRALAHLYDEYGLAGILQALYRILVTRQIVSRHVTLKPFMLKEIAHDTLQLRQVLSLLDLEVPE